MIKFYNQWENCKIKDFEICLFSVFVCYDNMYKPNRAYGFCLFGFVMEVSE